MDIIGTYSNHRNRADLLQRTDMVAAVLAETGRVERRQGLLPSQVGVYFVLALGLFPQVGYLRVWGMLGGTSPGAVRVSEKALRDVRRRLSSPFGR